MNKILRVFLDTDMRKQHDGLFQVAADHKVNVKNLDPGEHVIFINSALNKIKIYSARGLLSYYRKDKGKIDLNLIEHIPESFNSFGVVEWKKAERTALEAKLGKSKSSQ